MTDERGIRVLIADDIAETRDSLTRLLGLESDIEVVGTAFDGRQAVDMAGKLQPDIVLMDVHMPGLDGVAATEAIRRQWPYVQVIMMSVHDEPEYFRKSMMVGARDFFIKPFSGEELAESIRRVHKTAPVVAAPVAQTADGGPGTATTHASHGKVFTVFSPKGGVGCTTVACNLAVALAATEGQRVALVDCSLQFGDVGLFLNLHYPKSIVDLVPYVDELDGEMIASCMAPHESGLKVLLGPPRPEMAELVTAEALKAILSKLRDQFDYVVVDTWPSFQESVLGVLDLSDRILVLLTLEMPAIKNAKLFLEIADALEYAPDKIALVMNRSDSAGGIELADVESTLGRRVVGSIVSDGKLAIRALNLGVPFVQCARDSRLAKGVFDLSSYLVQRPPIGRVAAVHETKPVAPPKPSAPPPSPRRGGFSVLRPWFDPVGSRSDE